MSSALERLKALRKPGGTNPPAMPVEARRSPVAASSAPVVCSAAEREHVAAWARQDPANALYMLDLIGREFMIGAIKQQRAEIAEPAPAKEIVRAGQCSLFDNWPKGKRPNKNKGEPNAGAPRYQVTMELWTIGEGVAIESEANSAFLATAPLLDHAELTKRIEKLRKLGGRPWRKKHPDDALGADLEAFGQRLLTMSASNPDMLYGPVFTTVSGTRYFNGHYVQARADTIGTQAFAVELHREGFEPITFRRFATTLPNLQPLGGYVIGHSRITNRGDLSAWRTANL